LRVGNHTKIWVVGQFEICLQKYERRSQTDAAMNATNPPSIMAEVIPFGPGQDAANPTKEVAKPENAIANQRIRFLGTVLAGSTTRANVIGKLTTKATPTIL